MSNAIASYLKYAYLQIATEAFIAPKGTSPATPDSKVSNVTLSALEAARRVLTDGNTRSSRFTEAEATAFAPGWTVVEHIANTETGFSGTLFKYEGELNEAFGLTPGETVIVFRSTEFADDATRDSIAANLHDIKGCGWAFGQIDDMKKWADELRASGKLTGPHTVVGYSLGAHLATAYNLLYPGAGGGITHTVTFNGAGVGNLAAGQSLASVIDTFRTYRNRDDNADLFAPGSEAQALYTELSAVFFEGADVTLAQAQEAQARVSAALARYPIGGTQRQNLKLLQDALKGVESIAYEAGRTQRGISSGTDSPPVLHVPTSQLAAISLDYQLAHLKAAELTKSHHTDLLLATKDGFFGRDTRRQGELSNFEELYGANPPSAVANSQWHLGVSVPVFIEDQPLMRGNAVPSIISETIKAGEARVLADNFDIDDFGDTHSIMLMVDSLSLMNVFVRLDPRVTLKQMAGLFAAGSANAANKSTEYVNGGQGACEGDSLEAILDALCKLLLGNDPEMRKDYNRLIGGTWADPNLRKPYQEKIAALNKLIDDNRLDGKIEVLLLAEMNARELAQRAGTEAEGIAVRYALKELNPFALVNADYSAYNGDHELDLYDKDTQKGLTERWLSGRAKALAGKNAANLNNLKTDGTLSPYGMGKLVYMEDEATGTAIQFAALGDVAAAAASVEPAAFARSAGPMGFTDANPQIRFGGKGADALEGAGEDDQLYGGDGADALSGAGGKDYLEGGAGADALDGGAGDDQLLGGEGNDTLNGGEGKDQLDGGKGADALDGGDGDDQLAGGEDGDTLKGGSGNDWLDGGKGADRLEGGEGNDRLTGGGDTDTLIGGAGNDWLNGGTGADRYEFTGAFGTDTIEDEDGQGSVWIDGQQITGVFKTADGVPGLYHDEAKQYQIVRTFEEGASATLIITATAHPEQGAVFVRNWSSGQWGISLEEGEAPEPPPPSGTQGNAGQNWLIAGELGTQIHGGDGKDILLGYYDDDLLLGDGGDDWITGGGGIDTVDGGAGNDYITGVDGGEFARGGEGNDIISATGVEYLWAGGTSHGLYSDPIWTDLSQYWTPGVRRIDLSTQAPIHVEYNGGVLYGTFAGASSHGNGWTYRFTIPGLNSLRYFHPTYAPDGESSDNTEHRIELMPRTTQSVVLYGEDGDDLLDANDGNDRLSGGTGNDTVLGNGGHDLIDGGSGADLLAGGLGNDTLGGGEGDDQLYGEADNDYLIGGGGHDQLLGQDGSDAIEGGEGNDSLWGDAPEEDIQGTPAAHGRDTLDGGAGDDILYGGLNDDTLIGGEGNDTLRGDFEGDDYADLHGNDLIDGGAGDDWFAGGGGGDTLLGGEGNDYGEGGKGNDELDGGAGNDTLWGDEGDDSLLGGEGNDSFEGGEGKDSLDGGAGDDTLWGGEDNDTLASGSGADYLDGNAGDDLLDGGSGNDTLHGGDGNDTLIGGGGIDYLAGGAGDDTYYLTAGDAGKSETSIVDTIDDSSGNNTVVLASVIDRVALRASGYGASDLLLQYGGSEAIIIKNGIVGTVKTFRLGTGETVSLDDLMQATMTSSLTLTGAAPGATLAGGLGNDTLAGHAGGSVFRGGRGADALLGQAGDDVYRLNLGDGWDSISDTGGVDRIELGAGVTPDNVALARSGNNLVISIDGGADSVTISQYFAASGANRIESIRFADEANTTWDEAAILAILTSGAEGDGTLYGTEGNDTLRGTDGDDTLHGLGGADRLYGEAGNDSLDGGLGDDQLYGGEGNDTLNGGVGSDSLRGDGGDDTYLLDTASGKDWIYEAGGQDTLRFAPGVAPEQVALYRLGNDLVIGLTHAPSFQTTVVGYFAAADKQVERIVFDDGGVVWNAADIQSRVLGGGSADTLTGTAGDDLYIVDSRDDVIVEGPDQGTDTVETFLDYTLPPNVENLTLTGTLPASGTGNELDNVIRGNVADNVLNGMRGTDTLIGGLGDDSYVVGRDDGYRTDLDVIVENPGEGIDTIYTESTWSYTLRPNVENLTLFNPESLPGYYYTVTFTGNELDNVITGPAFDGNYANMIYDGGAGADTMIADEGEGGTFHIDNPGDRIEIRPMVHHRALRVVSTLDWTLDALFDHLELKAGGAAVTATGNARNNELVGNQNDNVLVGFDGNDSFRGRLGADQYIGGAGDDTYYVDSGNYYNNIYTGDPFQYVIQEAGAAIDDSIVELAGEGTDTVVTTFDYTLGDNLENLTLASYRPSLGSETMYHARMGTGNALNNVIRGNDGANVLDGKAGADTLIGGNGDDTYYVDDAGDVIQEYGAGAYTSDTVISTIGHTLGDNLENLTLIGATGAEGRGNALNNRLDGSQNAVADTLKGGLGDDTYVIGAGDIALENAGEGTDTIESAGNIDLTAHTHIENLTLVGTVGATGTGTAGNNRLDGSRNTVADTLIGGLGDDTYVVGEGDSIIETADGGQDTALVAAADYHLGGHVENATVTGYEEAWGITGNAQANQLEGNWGDNRLDGGGGADTLIGWGGSDTYVIDSADDLIVEEDYYDGTDTVITQFDGYTLGTGLENLTLADGVSTGSGNAKANLITGNAGNNALDGGAGNDTLEGGLGDDTLDGGAGNDSMIGGAGNDTYLINSSTDQVTELADEGIDTVKSTVGHTLKDNVENLILLGTTNIAGNGNALNNVLDGSQNSAANTLKGLAGDDIYIIGAGDIVNEAAGQGTDTVYSSLTTAYSLTTNVENLILIGEATAGNGNSAANTLTGNALNNTLDGKAGADVMIGGAGDDTYYVDNASDRITELAGEGVDTVLASAAHTLDDNVEHLTLTGGSSIGGTGNALANRITGNTGHNTLTGGAGNDTLIGGGGNDTLRGGDDDDTYLLTSAAFTAGNAVIVDDNGGVLQLDGVLLTGAGFTASGTNQWSKGALTATLSGTTLTLKQTGSTGRIELRNYAHGRYSLSLGDEPANHAPAIGTVLTNQSATEDVEWAWTVPADAFTDADAGDTLTYAAKLADGAALPTWLVFNPVTRTFTCNPDNSMVGTLNVRITATDTGGLSANQTFTFTVANVNDAPTAHGSLTDAAGQQGLSWSWALPAGAFTDIDVGDTLSYSATLTDGGALPGWLNIDPATGALTGTPASAGTLNLRITATDTGGLSASHTLVLGIAPAAPTNHAPVIGTALTNQNATEDTPWAWTVPAGAFTDVDAGDTLTYAAQLADGTALPGWLHFDAATRSFTCNPDNSMVGSLNVRITATDTGGLSANQSFTFTVVNTNDAPVIGTALTAQSTTENAPWSYTVPASAFTDVDVGDTLTLSATLADGTALPAWLTFNPATRTLANAAGSSAAGTFALRITATDVAGASVSQSFTLTVDPAPVGPVLPTPTLIGTSGNDTLTGTAGNDVIDGGLGADRMSGGLGDDIYFVDNAGDVVVEASGQGTDTIYSSVTYPLLPNNVENLILTGTGAINGTGNTANNRITGNAAANILDGQKGNDTLEGGAGDDLYIVDSRDDVIIEEAGAGNDSVTSSVTYTLLGTHADNLTLTGASSIHATGNDLDNRLTGNSASNTLTGGDGDDTLDGAAGNDMLLGGAGNDHLQMSLGSDTLRGEADDDTYHLSSDALLAGGVAIIIDDGGALYLDDTLLTGASFQYSAPNQWTRGELTATLSGGILTLKQAGGAGRVEVRNYTPGSYGLTLPTAGGTPTNHAPTIGTALTNQSATEDVEWAWTVPTGAFTDVDAGDTLTYAAKLADGTALPGWLVFNAATRTFTCNPDNSMVGSLNVRVTATDTGGLSANQTFTFTVANVNDAPEAHGSLTDAAGQAGQAWNWTLPEGAFTDVDAGDTLTYSATLADGSARPGWLAIDPATGALTGTPASAGMLDLRIIATDRAGETASHTLRLTVGAAPPVNHAPAIGTALTNQNAAEDTPWTWTVPADAFTDADAGDALTYAAQLADGTALPGWLVFNTATRTFTCTPDNSMVGSLNVRITATDTGGLSANQTFTLTVANTNDAPVIGTALTGQSATEEDLWNWTIPAGAFTDMDEGDILTYTVTRADGTARPLWLGFDPVTRLLFGIPDNGAAGALDLRVTATDLAGASVSQDFTLTVAPVPVGPALPTPTMVGTSGNDTLTGTAGNDVIDGGLGADRMSGGLGDDAYFVDNAGDLAIETPYQGTDIVYSTVDYTLRDNVENLTLIGTSAINATGNGAGNILVGNSAANILDGKYGDDTLKGGAGDDLYIVDRVGDVVVEEANGGIDTIQSAATYTLSDHVEHLTLTGTQTLNGTGNELANRITGNSAANTLDGKAGDDTLIGGLGKDTYLFGRNGGADTIIENDATAGVADLLKLGADIAANQIWFRRIDDSLELSLIGTDDKITIQDWYAGQQHHVEQFKTADRTLLDSQVDNLVQAMAAFAPPAAGQTSLPPDYQAALATVIAANWK